METTTPHLTVDALVDATPAHRDRVVDFFRALSIAVVVLWHWTFSITHWGDGSLRMPNPIGEVPGLWSATWLLQVMPLFFLVGGYSNLVGWESVTRDGQGAVAFLRKRLSRLTRPVAVYVACWTVFDLAWQAGGGRSVLDWGMVVFVPLWFLGVYVAVVALAPLTARLHQTHAGATLGVLAGGIALAEIGRFALDIGAAAWLGAALVWLFCHQLGYWWRTWTAAGGHDPARGWYLLAAGLAGLVLLTNLGPYPRSMVAVGGGEISNMNPTTACIAALAVLQLGVVLLLRPALTRWLERREVWRTVVAANGVAMTVFCWHMTALVAFLVAYELVGFGLGDEPTALWWLSRPVWIVGPGVVLAALLPIFARFEMPKGAVASRR